jgi:hypothetical protein
MQHMSMRATRCITCCCLTAPAGTCRNLNGTETAADSWPSPNGGSIQSKEWVELGFNSQEHLERTRGSHMKRPFTNVHGSQVKAMLAQQHKRWQNEPLASALAQLEKDRQLGVIVRDLKLEWEVLSGIHSVVNKQPHDLAKVQVLVPSYRSSMATFEFAQPGGNPKPSLRLRLFYDHAILNHLLQLAELLHSMGLSFALMQSKFLEANNQPVDNRFRILPGGGVECADSLGNEPVLQTLQHIYERTFAKHRLHNTELVEKRAEAKAADLQVFNEAIDAVSASDDE